MDGPIPQVAKTDVAFPLRALPSRCPQLNINSHRMMPDPRMTEHKNDAVLPESYTVSVTSTPSTRSSLFSREKSLARECRTALVELVHPSPPPTPKAKPEWDDVVRLDSVPWRTADSRKRTHSEKEPWRGPVKRRCSDSDEGSCSLQLPSVGDIINPQIQKDVTYLSSDSRRRWSTSCASSEPATREDYTMPLSAFSPGHDLITHSLNALRRERDVSRTLPPLPQPRGLGNQPLPSVEGPPFLFQGPTRYPHDQHESYYQPQQQPSPPMEPGRNGGDDLKIDTHINVKYATEELDFTRYHRVDRNTKWEDVRRLFNIQFPIPGLPRTRQGIQGGYYRQNDGQVPLTADQGNVLGFLANGHVQQSRTKVREQHDKKLFGLAVLFPERAMNYSWVDPETRQMAAELGKSSHPSLWSIRSQHKLNGLLTCWTATKRALQKEQAKQAAIFRGTWVDRVEDGSCACCFKEDRESSKRTTKNRDKAAFFQRCGSIDIKCETSLKFDIAFDPSK